MIMKKKLLFLLLICSQFLFSQKKILLFSPESYQYKVQSEFVKKNKVNTITVFYQHEFVKGNHLDEKLLISSIEKKIPNKKATGYASLDWEGEALRAVTDHTEASDFYMKQMIKAIKVAKKMKITAGSLTTAMNALVNKKYVLRERGEKDRRVVYIWLTEKGQRAYRHHAKFHEQMTNAVIEELDETEIPVLLKTLRGLDTFFRSYSDNQDRS